MSEAWIGWALVAGVAIGAACIAHAVSRRFEGASIASGLGTSLVVNAYWVVKQGYFEGWYFISFCTVAAVAVTIAFLVGAVFRRARGG